jgi:hypothetical protein
MPIAAKGMVAATPLGGVAAGGVAAVGREE